MMAALQKLLDWVVSVISLLLSFLPDSPFQFEAASQFRIIMGYVNYFVPIQAYVRILSAWLVAVGAYYIYSAVLRWVKAIE